MHSQCVPNVCAHACVHSRLIYKIAPSNGNRTVVAQIPLSNNGDLLNLTTCTATGAGINYMDPIFKAAYAHDMTLTTNYIVLPTTTYFFNPCALSTLAARDIGWTADMCCWLHLFQTVYRA